MTIRQKESPDVVPAKEFGHVAYRHFIRFGAVCAALVAIITLAYFVPKGAMDANAIFHMPEEQRNQGRHLDTLSVKMDRLTTKVDRLDSIGHDLKYWQDTVQKNRNAIMKAQPVMIDIEQRLKAVERRNGLGFYPDSEEQFMAEYFTKQP